jgi:hypothetical protein
MGYALHGYGLLSTRSNNAFLRDEYNNIEESPCQCKIHPSQDLFPVPWDGTGDAVCHDTRLSVPTAIVSP